MSNKFLQDVLNTCKKAREQEVKLLAPQSTASQKKALQEEYSEDDCSLPGIIVNKPNKKKVLHYFEERLKGLIAEEMT